MNDLQSLVNMMWSTNVENMSSRRNNFGLGPHFGKVSAQPHTIVKQICFPNGNVLFLSLFSLFKNWMHNVVWGCAEILPAFFPQNKHMPLKKMSIRPTCKAVTIVSRTLRVLNIQQWHLSYIYSFIHFYYVGKICTDNTPNNSHAKWEDYMKTWNYLKISFDQEMGQEYFPIV